MTLKQWETNGWLKAEPTSQDEIANLLAIVERDLKDATGSVSPDWQFGIAYNAALKLCTIVLRAEGYRAAHGLQHYRTIMAMLLTLDIQGMTMRTTSTHAGQSGTPWNTIMLAGLPKPMRKSFSSSPRSFVKRSLHGSRKAIPNCFRR